MIVKVEGYSPEGFKVFLEADVPDMRRAKAFTQNAFKSGFTPEQPDMDARKTETITTVVRRRHIDGNGKETPVIDLYPAWGVRSYGQFRFVGMYLNNAKAIAEFEVQAGVKLDDLPLYDDDRPIKRNVHRKLDYEIPCKPFIAIKQFVEEKEIGGKVEKAYKFVGYGVAEDDADPDPVPPPQQRAASSTPASGPQKPTLLPQRGQILPPSNPPRPAAPPSAAHPGAPLTTSATR